MKIYAEKDDGTRVEIREVDTMNKDCDIVFFMVSGILRQEDINNMEYGLSRKTGKKCIVLDARFTKVATL